MNTKSFIQLINATRDVGDAANGAAVHIARYHRSVFTGLEIIARHAIFDKPSLVRTGKGFLEHLYLLYLLFYVPVRNHFIGSLVNNDDE